MCSGRAEVLAGRGGGLDQLLGVVHRGVAEHALVAPGPGEPSFLFDAPGFGLGVIDAGRGDSEWRQTQCRGSSGRVEVQDLCTGDIAREQSVSLDQPCPSKLLAVGHQDVGNVDASGGKFPEAFEVRDGGAERTGLSGDGLLRPEAGSDHESSEQEHSE